MIDIHNMEVHERCETTKDIDRDTESIMQIDEINQKIWVMSDDLNNLSCCKYRNDTAIKHAYVNVPAACTVAHINGVPQQGPPYISRVDACAMVKLIILPHAAFARGPTYQNHHGRRMQNGKTKKDVETWNHF